MLKKYDELVKINVSEYTDKRDGYDYLNWAKCIDLLHKNGAEVVYFTPVVDERTGSSLFMSEQTFEDNKGALNRCYEVEVHIVIDELEFNQRVPLTSGTTPVKDHWLTQQQVWNAQTRAFVKGVAIRTGLGFNLWLKNEQDEQEIASYFDNPENHRALVIKDRIGDKVTRLMKDKGMTADEVAEACGLSGKDEINMFITMLKNIHNFEVRLNKQL